MARSDMVELESFASCRNGNIRYISKTGASVRFIFAWLNLVKSLVLQDKDRNIGVLSVILPLKELSTIKIGRTSSTTRLLK